MLQKFKKFLYKYILRRKYYRSGSCKACGACCANIYIQHAKSVIQTEEEYEDLKQRYWFYKDLKVIGKDEIGLIFACSNLDKETKLCKVHKNRPELCKRYPQEEIFMMGGELKEDCGYKFTPIDTFDDVLANIAKKTLKPVTFFCEEKYETPKKD